MAFGICNEKNKRNAHENFVRNGIHEFAEIAHLIKFSGKVAIKTVADCSNNKKNSCQDVVIKSQAIAHGKEQKDPKKRHCIRKIHATELMRSYARSPATDS